MSDKNTYIDIYGDKCPEELKRPIIKSFARACRAVSTKYKLNIVDFIKEFLASDIAKTYQENYTLHSQGSNVIVQRILNTFNKKI